MFPERNKFYVRYSKDQIKNYFFELSFNLSYFAGKLFLAGNCEKYLLKHSSGKVLLSLCQCGQVKFSRIQETMSGLIVLLKVRIVVVTMTMNKNKSAFQSYSLLSQILLMIDSSLD